MKIGQAAPHNAHGSISNIALRCRGDNTKRENLVHSSVVTSTYTALMPLGRPIEEDKLTHELYAKRIKAVERAVKGTYPVLTS